MADDSESFISWVYDELSTGSASALVSGRIYRTGQVPQTATYPGRMIVLSKVTGRALHSQGPRISVSNLLAQIEVLGARGDAYEDLSALVNAIVADLDGERPLSVPYAAKITCMVEEWLPDRVDPLDPEIAIRGVVVRGILQPNLS